MVRETNNILEGMKTTWVDDKMEVEEKMSDKELGFLLWQIQEFESFYPIYKSMLKEYLAKKTIVEQEKLICERRWRKILVPCEQFKGKAAFVIVPTRTGGIDSIKSLGSRKFHGSCLACPGLQGLRIGHNQWFSFPHKPLVLI